jgi:hypothetical protein
VKVAGGIRTTKDAIRHLVLVNETLGAAWLDPDRYRIGASGLLTDLLMQRQKLATGVYGSADPSPSTEHLLERRSHRVPLPHRPRRPRVGLRARAGEPRGRSPRRAWTDGLCTSVAHGSPRRTARRSRRTPPRPRSTSPTSRSPARPTSTARSRPPCGAPRVVGLTGHRAREASCSASPACCRSGRASSPSSRRSTTASRSARPRLRRPDGRRAPLPPRRLGGQARLGGLGPRPRPSASSVRSSRGTSRC